MVPRDSRWPRVVDRIVAKTKGLRPTPFESHLFQDRRSSDHFLLETESIAHNTMMVCLPTTFDLKSLRDLVEQKLCQLGMLEPAQFPLTERNVVKADRLCGVYYCLHGPRSVKFTAIADFDRQSLILYGSDGSRTMIEKLAA